MKKTLTLLAFSLLFHKTGQAQVTPPTYVSQNGLVGWWPFSGNANDQSILGNHGVANGAVLTTDRAGNVGSAYTFNGTSSYIEVPDTASLRVRKLTMAAWVYSTNPDPDFHNLRDEVIYKARKSDAYGEAYSLQMGVSAAVKIGSGCQAGVGWQVSWFNNNFALTGIWTHLCSTFDGSYLRNYINGVEVEAVSVSGLIDSCVGSNLRFGYAHDLYGKAWSGPFLGKIDDIGIWNRALFPGEILELYKGVPVATSAGADTVATDPNSIGQVAAPRIVMAPNPAHDAINLKRSAAGEQLQITISDLVGRAVLQTPFTGEEQQIRLNNLAGGLYLLTITNVQHVPLFREKLIVQ